MQVAVFHPGIQHSWQTALALDQLDCLAWYATSLFYQPGRWPYRLERHLPAGLAARLHAEFERFACPGLDPAKVRTAGISEWLERLARRAGAGALADWLDRFGNRRFAGHLAGALAGPEPFALWGYSNSADRAFALARQQGRRCILDRTIGDARAYNAAMAPVRQDYPQWFARADRPISSAQIAREQAEYDLADLILCGSRFAADTLRAHGGARIGAKLRIVPYCYDEALFGAQPVVSSLASYEPIRFLFVGQVHPRKGIHHLLEAFARLPQGAARLTVAGGLAAPAAALAPYRQRVTFLPSLPRAAVPALMAAHHVLVLPSYFEGSALCLLEGLASGLALIHTPQSGNGVTPQSGLLLARPDTDLLEQAMLAALADRDRLHGWRVAAQRQARGYSFARYRANLAAVLATLS